MTILTFQKALHKAEAKKYLLLGNGFSIALKPDIFTYGSLYENADFSDVPYARQIFEALGTRDFEAVIRLLIGISKVIAIYNNSDPAIANKIRQDANKIKTILVNTIAERHPDRPHSVTDEQYAACRAFLSNFSHIFTLNYDVLLYWALMQDDVDTLNDYSSWQFTPDVIGILRNKSSRNIELCLVCRSISSISLKEIGEINCYAKMAHPFLAILISLNGPSNEVNLLLIETAMRERLLTYDTGKTIVIATWDINSNAIVKNTVLPLQMRDFF